MLRILLVMCILYVVPYNNGQQEPLPLDVHAIDALKKFTMDVPDDENKLRRKRQEDIPSLNLYNMDVPEENKPRRKGQMEDNYAVTPFCGATALRLNFSLLKAYGVWYPVQASKLAYQLWVTSLYGVYGEAGRGSLGLMCPTWNIQPSNQINTINIQVTHQKKTIVLEAFLLSEGFSSKGSKWVVSWPNGQDTLTSVVAIGGHGGDEGNYDWMLTMDCDLKGVVSSDWAVFARKPTMSAESLSNITVIAHGIQGLKTTEITRTGEACEVYV